MYSSMLKRPRGASTCGSMQPRSCSRTSHATVARTAHLEWQGLMGLIGHAPDEHQLPPLSHLHCVEGGNRVCGVAGIARQRCH